jgi:hypothetical protein
MSAKNSRGRQRRGWLGSSCGAGWAQQEACRGLGGGRGEESPGSGGTLPGPVEGISGRLGCHSDGDMDRY